MTVGAYPLQFRTICRIHAYFSCRKFDPVARKTSATSNFRRTPFCPRKTETFGFRPKVFPRTPQDTSARRPRRGGGRRRDQSTWELIYYANGSCELGFGTDGHRRVSIKSKTCGLGDCLAECLIKYFIPFEVTARKLHKAQQTMVRVGGHCP